MCSLPSIHPELGRDCEGFEWFLEPERRGSISPDLLPSYFRSKAETPVDIEFDHDRAAMGECMCVYITLTNTVQFNR